MNDYVSMDAAVGVISRYVSFLLKFEDMQALVACDCGFGSVLYPVQTGNTLLSVIQLSQLYVNLKRSPVRRKKKIEHGSFKLCMET